MYRHPTIIEVRGAAQQRLSKLLEFFADHPEKTPPRYQARAKRLGALRSAGDYVAGMTDRYCNEQYQLCVAQSDLNDD